MVVLELFGLFEGNSSTPMVTPTPNPTLGEVFRWSFAQLGTPTGGLFLLILACMAAVVLWKMRDI